MKTQELLENREAFEHWLFNQPKDRVIEAGSADSCFVCSFIKETFPLPFEFSMCTDYYYDGMTKLGDLPDWIRLLISPDLLRKSHNAPMTVAEMQERYLKLWPETFIKKE